MNHNPAPRSKYKDRISRLIKGIANAKMFAWGLVVAAAGVTLAVIYTTIRYAPHYGLLKIPLVSWFVFILNGMLLALTGLSLLLGYWLRQERKQHRHTPVIPQQATIPVIHGHRSLEQPEFVVLLQTLFRDQAKNIHVRSLPGGYSGSTTVLVELQKLPDSHSERYVVKLGEQREMDHEHHKFRTFVQEQLNHAAEYAGYATWENTASIAYKFVGIDPQHEILSFHQFYDGYAALEVVAVVKTVSQHLNAAWYQSQHSVQVDLFQEYWLLQQKREAILEHISAIIADDDPYRLNFSLVKRRLSETQRPSFCPDTVTHWYDPVAFLRRWPAKVLNVPIYRAIVHGDLNARNILLEIQMDRRKRVWFIDFSHTGSGLSGERAAQAKHQHLPIPSDEGHILRDFSRLEADIKFLLTRLDGNNDLHRAIAFEEKLLARGMALDDLSISPPPDGILGDERFRKAWQVIRAIRQEATHHLVHPDDPRAYYFSLLNATLTTLYYHPGQFAGDNTGRRQKRYALLAAGMLCAYL